MSYEFRFYQDDPVSTLRKFRTIEKILISVILKIEPRLLRSTHFALASFSRTHSLRSYSLLSVARMPPKKTPAKQSASKKPSSKGKKTPKEVKVPAIPGNAMLKRLALAGAESSDVQVSKEIYPHVLALYLRAFREQVGIARDALKAHQDKLSEKGKDLSYNLSYKLLGDLPILTSEKKAKKLQTCLQASKGKDEMVLRHCLIGPRAAFKRYLTMGSADGKIKPLFGGSHPYRFPKEAINALQYSVEQTVISSIKSAWLSLGKGKKKLMHKHFVEVGFALGDAPGKASPKPKVVKAKAGSKAKAKAGSKGKKAKVQRKVVEEVEVVLEEAIPETPVKSKGKKPAPKGKGKKSGPRGKKGGKGKKKVME